eukprot:1227433-Amphidinium_carterae.1
MSFNSLQEVALCIVVSLGWSWQLGVLGGSCAGYVNPTGMSRIAWPEAVMVLEALKRRQTQPDVEAYGRSLGSR